MRDELAAVAAICDLMGAGRAADGVREIIKNGKNDFLARNVCRTSLHSGLIVSTVWATDCQKYETALLDKNGAHPVERYSDTIDAMQGHHRWVAFADEGVGKTITVLGDADGFVKPHETTLESFR